MEYYECRSGPYHITTDPECIDFETVQRFLAESYWASNRSAERIRRSIENSICFSLLEDGTQIGFARVVTDKADFAWLCDVFIESRHRGIGLGQMLMSCVLAHPELQGLRRWILATRDAHGLYEQYGFHALENPPRWMERTNN